MFFKAHKNIPFLTCRPLSYSKEVRLGIKSVYPVCFASSSNFQASIITQSNPQLYWAIPQSQQISL